MAVVILGGLATSTLLNLFLMPSLYSKFGHSRVTPDAALPLKAPNQPKELEAVPAK
jgi:hypothetical protein